MGTKTLYVRILRLRGFWKYRDFESIEILTWIRVKRPPFSAYSHAVLSSFCTCTRPFCPRHAA